jgi:hypothetical protein
MKPKLLPEMVNSAQISERREIKKGGSTQNTQKSHESALYEVEGEYEKQHERQAQGQLPRSKGNNQGGGRKSYE